MKNTKGESSRSDVNTVHPNIIKLSPDWNFTDEYDKPVCTFIPEVLSEINRIRSTDTKDFARLRLHFKNGDSKETVVPLSELDRMDWFKIDRRCLINPNYRKAKEFIANTIRSGLIATDQKETQYALDRLGIYHFKNTIVFAAGNRVIARSPATEFNFVLEQLPFRLDIDPTLTAKQAFDGMSELISLSPEIGRVLVAHVISGITRAAFKEAGLTPCAVLVIVGKSGMLKSNYVPHMVQLYNRNDEIRADTRFNSTPRFIEDILYEYSECTAVIDDLHTAEARGIKRTNEATAEEIIRRISDDTGRGRKEGNALVQNKFRGNVIFIGEYIIGKESTIPRALVVNLTKPPDGSILDKYQRHQPFHVSTFYYYFIEWYVNHFDEIRDEIDARLTRFREITADSEIHGRLRDTQFYLQVSYMIFLEFCRDSGFIRAEDAKDEYYVFASQLLELVQAQQARFSSAIEKSEDVNYLKLLCKLYKKNSFCLADNIKHFNSEKHDGLIHYDCLCLRGKSLDRKIRKIIPSFKHDDVIREFLDKKALKQVKEKYTVQIEGKRFYAIYLDELL